MKGSRTFLAGVCLLAAAFAVPGMAATMLEDLTVPADFSVDTGAPPKLAIRTSPQNLPVYVFGDDAPGKSNCNAGCIGAWSPVLASGGASPLGDWTIPHRWLCACKTFASNLSASLAATAAGVADVFLGCVTRHSTPPELIMP